MSTTIPTYHPLPAQHHRHQTLSNNNNNSNNNATVNLTPQQQQLLHTPIDNQGNTLLHAAIAGGDTLQAQGLLSLGADPNRQNNLGQAAVHLAVEGSNWDLLEHLLRHTNANVHLPALDGATVLHQAAALGASDQILFLVRCGAFLDAIDDSGDCPLHWAVREGSPAGVKTLLQLGADPLIFNEDGESPGDLAVECQEWECAEMLGRRSAEKEKRDGGFAGEKVWRRWQANGDSSKGRSEEEEEEEEDRDARDGNLWKRNRSGNWPQEISAFADGLRWVF